MLTTFTIQLFMHNLKIVLILNYKPSVSILLHQFYLEAMYANKENVCHVRTNALQTCFPP